MAEAANSIVPTLDEMLSVLQEITDPKILGIYLGIKSHQLEKFEKNHPNNVEGQKYDVLNHWEKNCEDCSWDRLATAVEKIGKHRVLAKKLREKNHIQAVREPEAKRIKKGDSSSMQGEKTSECPTVKQLKQYVKSFIGDKWEELAIELGLDEDEETAEKLEEIKMKREDNASMASYDILMLWRSNQNADRTWKELKNALAAVGLTDAVNSIDKYLGGDGKDVPPPTSTVATAAQQKSAPALAGQQQTKSKGYEIQMKPGESVRNYQHELAAPGIAGDNYIVAAPTNSGKTLVAALVMTDHLEKDSKQSRTARIVVVEKTRPLADQQRKRFAEFIPNATVECCTGYKSDIQSREQQPVHIKNALLYANIIVCTAGKLLSELQKEMVSLGQFSLMILDECHNAEKSSNYAQIMHVYLEQKAIMKDGMQLPQVIGLTATPGIGKNPGLNPVRAVDNLINLCALMDASSGIKTVQQHVEELNAIVQKPEYYQEVVDQNELRQEFIERVEENMQECEFFLNFDITGKQPHWSQKYEQAIKEVKVPLEENENPNDRDKISTIRLLECYSQTLMNYMELPCSQAMEPLNQYDDLTSSDKLSNHEKYLLERFTSLKSDLASLQLVENPTLKKLKERLTDTFTRKPDSEGIVFVRTREQAEAISDWISESEFAEKLKIRSHKLLGHKRQGEKGPSMSDEEQKMVVEAFHNGEYNLLISTSVAEEGLDIKRCNLVIRLHISSAKSKAQMQGRARAADSEIVTIVSNDPSKLYRDILNDELLLLMEKMIRNNFLPPRDVFIKTIATIQVAIRESLRKQKELQEARRSTHPAHTIVLKCKKCKDVACYGSDIYVVDKTSHHVVPGNVLCYEVSKHPRRGILQGCGALVIDKLYKIHCPNCNDCWGVLGTWPSKKEFPVLKCEYFNFFKDGRPIKIPKWKDRSFEVSPLSEWFAENGQQ